MSTDYQNSLSQIQHGIDIPKAANLIQHFKTARPQILSGQFQNNDPFTVSQTFEKSQVENLLTQEGCVALRAYFGMYPKDANTSEDRKGKIVLVLCGVDKDGNDLKLLPGDAPSGQIILQEAQLCPPFCSAPSQINQL